MKDIPYTSPYLSQIKEFKEEQDYPLVAELFLKSQKDPEYLRKLKTFQNNFFPESDSDQPMANIQSPGEGNRSTPLKEIKQNAETYVKESQNASASLAKLSASLSVLRALKVYREQ